MEGGDIEDEDLGSVADGYDSDELSEEDEKEPQKPQVSWRLCDAAQAACLPGRRAFHQAVHVPPLAGAKSLKDHHIFILGGEAEPKFRGREVVPFAITGAPRRDASPGAAADEGEDRFAVNRFEWRSPKAQTPGRLRSCSVTVVGGSLFVFGGLRLETLDAALGEERLGEGVYEKDQVSGELLAFDVRAGQWRKVWRAVGQTSAGDADGNGGRRSVPTSPTSDVSMAPELVPPSEAHYAMSGDMPQSRFEHGASTLQAAGHWMVVHGGRSPQRGAPLESCFALQVKEKALYWTELQPAKLERTGAAKDLNLRLQSLFARRGHSLCAVPGRAGRLAIFGGITDRGGGRGRVCAELVTVDISCKSGSYIIVPETAAGQGPSARNYHSAAVIGPCIAIFGGLGPTGESLNDLFLLHCGPMVWTTVRTPRNPEASGVIWPRPTYGHAAVTVEDLPGAPRGASMFIFGGIREGAEAGASLEEVYCLGFENDHSTAVEIDAFNVFPEGAILSLWDRLYENTRALEHEQMLRVARRNREIADAEHRLSDMQAALENEEQLAAKAEEQVAVGKGIVRIAEKALEAARKRMAAAMEEMRAEADAAEERVAETKRRLQRAETVRDVLEAGQWLPLADVAAHPNDPGAVFALSRKRFKDGSDAGIRRAGTWCGTAVTIEEIFMPKDGVMDNEASGILSQSWELTIKKELRRVRRLSHPNLVEYFGGTIDGNSLLLISEPPLVPLLVEMRARRRQHLEPHGQGRMTVIRDVALAIEYLHCKGFVHLNLGLDAIFLRDAPHIVAKLGGLLPTRIFARARREVNVAVRGQRGVLGAETSVTTAVRLDAAQLASLQKARDRLQDPRTQDIFQLGSIVLELFGSEEAVETGHDENDQAAGGRPRETLELPAVVLSSAAVARIQNKVLRLVVMRCMDKDPNQRMSASLAVKTIESAKCGDGLSGVDPVIDPDESIESPLVDDDLEDCYEDRHDRPIALYVAN